MNGGTGILFAAVLVAVVLWVVFVVADDRP